MTRCGLALNTGIDTLYFVLEPAKRLMECLTAIPTLKLREIQEVCRSNVLEIK